MSKPVHDLPYLSDLPGLLPNRACRPCVSIKAKCIPLAGSEEKTCERCHRLGKNCTTPRPKSRKRAAVHTTSVNSSDFQEHSDAVPSVPSPQFHPTAVAHSETLEPSPYPRMSGSYPVEAIPTPPVSTREPVYSPDKGTNTLPVTEALNQDAFFKGRPQTAGTAFDVSPEIGHSFVRPTHEMLFEHFHDQMSPYFPFITLTHDRTKMRQDRPFTYTACIMAAAHRDPTLQYRICRDMLRYIGEHLLLLGEKSLDFLQGLLLMMNWYHVYTHHNPQLMNLLHLAQALLVDLGLNRSPGTGLFQIRPSNDAAKMLHGQLFESHQQSLEERRACLAVYHIQAKLAACFRRLDNMCWSEHLEECCQLLQENATECPRDAHAVAFVRLDHLVDRYRNIDGGQQKLTMPLQVYIKLLSAEIETFKQNLPPSLQCDTTMRTHVQTAQIALFERVINSDTIDPAHKVEALHSCLAGVLEYFNSFISSEVEHMSHLPFLAWADVAHAFDILAKLSFAEVENWDLEYVRNNPGFIALSDGIIRKLNEAQSHENIHHSDNKSIRYKVSANRLEKFKQWYLQRIDLESKARSDRLESEVGSSAPAFDPNSGSYFSDFADIVWQDIAFTNDWASFDSTFNFTT